MARQASLFQRNPPSHNPCPWLWIAEQDLDSKVKGGQITDILWNFLVIQVRHVKRSSNDNGFGYHEKSLGIVTMEGKPFVELTNPTRAEISCPMNFKFYPFDTQFCNFIIEPLMFDVRLLPYFVHSKQLDEQNIEMSYDIDIQPLLPQYLVRPSDEVIFCFTFLSHFTLFAGYWGTYEATLSWKNRLQHLPCWVHLQTCQEIQQIYLHLLHTKVRQQKRDSVVLSQCIKEKGVGGLSPNLYCILLGPPKYLHLTYILDFCI